ncbi:MAG: enoyl-CoA hydratase/isomerase family protein [Planctomycetota bacterium]|jgi:cyclohexa-1,5-dienecarbonyl-CoA hydratase
MSESTDTSAPLFHTLEEEGGLLRITLDAQPGNIIDTAMLRAIMHVLDEHARRAIRCIVFDHTGKHFSFGASVEEHRPEQVAGMLGEFHGLFRRLIELAKPTIAVVRGQCLGGGMELAAFCNFIFAAPKANFAQPEIQLGVLPPVASLILPPRVGQALADELCLTGAGIGAEAAQAAGLVRTVAEDPAAAALEFARTQLLPHSGAALTLATRAARDQFNRNFLERIDALERLYLDDLMGTHDAVEGIAAFCAKRKPEWRHA